MSWTYTVLLGEVEGAVRAHGLDACIVFLHDISYGTPSLALDFMEPLRAPVCDLLVLNILNHNILKNADFRFDSEHDAYYIWQPPKTPKSRLATETKAEFTLGK